LTRLTVIADTSFLMTPGLYGVDIFAELDRLLQGDYELIVPEVVLKELEKLSKAGDPEERAAAKIGLSLSSKLKVLEAEGRADDVLLKLAKERKCAVGTIDFALRKELRRNGITVIFLREKSHLAVDGPIG
jgi:rRNA-processing protein FCF1